jgi:PAS domain S-box-containing protein
MAAPLLLAFPFLLSCQVDRRAIRIGVLDAHGRGQTEAALQPWVNYLESQVAGHSSAIVVYSTTSFLLTAATAVSGWTVPISYQSVHTILKRSRPPPYQDYGRITIEGIIRDHWELFLTLVLIAVVAIAAVLALLVRLHLRNRQAHNDLQVELEANRRISGDLAQQAQLLKQSGEAIEAIVTGTSSVLGQEFFQSVVLQLASTLRTRYCFIGELHPKEHGVIRTVAVADGGVSGANFEYTLKGAPCANVVGRSLCFYPSGVQRQFPEDAGLARMAAEGYLGVPLASSSGEPLGLMVVIDDKPLPESELPKKLLTVFAARVSVELERIRAEVARSISERRYSMLFEQMISGFALHEVICDLEGKPCDYRYLEVNPSFERILGLAAKDVVGKRVLELFPRLEKSWIYRLGSVALTGQPVQFEDYVSQLDRYYEVRAFSPERGKFAVVFHDVSERKRAEKAVRESEERFRVAAENASDLIFEWDITADRVDFHSRMLQGTSVNGIVVPVNISQWQANIHPEDLPKTLKSLRSLLGSGVPFVEEYRFLAQDGSWRHLAHRAVAYRREDGEVRTVLGVVTDNTERKQAEEERERLQSQLLLAQKLESVGRLAGGVAHDFNNLLTVINGYSQLALKKLEPDDPAYPNIQEIHKAGERAADLTRQLLAFGRKQILQPKVLNPNEVLRDVERMLRRIIGEHVELVCLLDPDLGCVEADPGQLEQVVLNLAANARDAMPEGGRLVLQSSNVDAGELYASEHFGLKPGRYVLLSVTDSGEGMDEATQRRIFEPFFTTKQHGKGTGLGLSSVYGTVTQSGGHISVHSRPKEGSTFHVFLPRVEQGVPLTPAHGTKSALMGRETILLVEDQLEVRRLASEALRAYGYRVIEAAGGEEAVETLLGGQEQVDLLVTDQVMPGMTGLQLAQRMRAVNPRVKVLLISGYSSITLPPPDPHGDSIVYLPKPFGPDTLAAKVREVLGPLA